MLDVWIDGLSGIPALFSSLQAGFDELDHKRWVGPDDTEYHLRWFDALFIEYTGNADHAFKDSAHLVVAETVKKSRGVKEGRIRPADGAVPALRVRTEAFA